MEPLFDLTSTFGVSGTLNHFFNGFSQLAVNPNDSVARQSVIDLAGQVAQCFQRASAGISQASANADNQTCDAAATVNRLSAQITSINALSRRLRSPPDPGSMRNCTPPRRALGVVNYNVIADGAVNVYLGGQTPLVIGNHQFVIQADLSGGTTVIRDSQNNDVTSQVLRGSLGALVREKNSTLAGYSTQLNLLDLFVDTVNTTLAQGVDRTAVPAVNLLQYNQPSDAAATMAVTGITDDIAAARPGAPGGNGNALAIHQLADTAAISGFTFTQFWGGRGPLPTAIPQPPARSEPVSGHHHPSRAQRQQQTGVSIDQKPCACCNSSNPTSHRKTGGRIGQFDDHTLEHGDPLICSPASTHPRSSSQHLNRV